MKINRIVDIYLKNMQNKFKISVKRIGRVNKELARELAI